MKLDSEVVRLTFGKKTKYAGPIIMGPPMLYADGITFHNGNVTGQGEDPTKKLEGLKSELRNMSLVMMKPLTSRKL
jgi:hypothetical protein